MATTNKAGQVVSQVRAISTQIIELSETLNKVNARYVKNGGQAFLHPFFTEADGETARTDLDVTEAQIVTCISALQQMTTWLNNKMDVFIQAE